MLHKGRYFLANPEHLNILRQGASEWNRWRTANPGVKPDLHKSFICGPEPSGEFFRPSDPSETVVVPPSLDWVAFSGASLFQANLRGADLRSVDLHKAILCQADLSEADLTGADLSGANLNDAALNETIFDEATLSGASFIGAKLQGASFIKATVDSAVFASANLSKAKLRGAVLSMANFIDADLTGADLSDADLEHAVLVRTILNKAILTGCKVFGASVWDVQLDEAIQQSLIITPNDEATITVDNLRVAQFIYLILYNKHIRDVIDTVGQKAILILGRFSPERKAVLDAIAGALRTKDYLPILFDFEKSTQRDFTETIKVLAGLSLFVIADITNPKSSPLELQATVPDYMIPFVPIIQSGEEPFSMLANLHSTYRSVLEPRRYPTKERIVERLEEVIIKPALQRHSELVARKNETMSVIDI
jgi:uncharacterized protein YjbI with pentapeptide repeats